MGKFSVTVTKTGEKGKGVVIVTIRLLNIKADGGEGKKITNVGGSNQKKTILVQKRPLLVKSHQEKGDGGHNRVQDFEFTVDTFNTEFCSICLKKKSH